MGDHGFDGMALLPLCSGDVLVAAGSDLAPAHDGRRRRGEEGGGIPGTVQRSDPGCVGCAECRIFCGECIPGGAEGVAADLSRRGKDIERITDDRKTAAAADADGADPGRIQPACTDG